jgi:hypothetical protein
MAPSCRPVATAACAAGGIGGVAIGNGSYLNQAIGYSGDFGPVNLAATVGLDPDVDDGNHAYAIKAEFDINPVRVWVAHANADDYNVDADREVSKIGASFSSGPFGVMAQYEAIKDIVDHMMIAGTYKMGANTFMLGFGVGDSDIDGALDQQWLALGVSHAFTRQVSVHAGVRASEYADSDADETVVGAGMRVTF